MMPAGGCRACGAPLRTTFVDLGMLPLCQTYPRADELAQMERFYPLHAFVCGECFLAQLPVYASPEEIFSEYAYFSSTSESWLRHVEALARELTGRLALGAGSHVVEVASNDGYLLQFFARRGISVLGIEPAANVAATAVKKGIPTLVKFFGLDTATQIASDGHRADLLLALNVLDHVPDIRGFIAGMRALLKPTGVGVLEFPYLCRLIEHNEFDTIYHDRFSYLSFHTVERIAREEGLTVFDALELPTHGGSLRLYLRASEACGAPADRVAELHRQEARDGVTRLDYYRGFSARVHECKRALLNTLIELKRRGRSIVGYGVPAKGNVLLNYCGIRTDFLDYVVDRSPYKQGKYTPGTHIPIHPVEKVEETHPDYLLILPWNIREEVMDQMAHVRSWGGQFIVPIPEARIC